MRVFLLSAVLALSAFSGLAAAHEHPPCGLSKHVAEVHFWAGPECVGATVTNPVLICGGGIHQHNFGLHVLVFGGPGCETGAILECENDIIVLPCSGTLP